ncbi:MarR family winged helix-turn-helix transcriptional regulator [Aciditerrimonas ferrireducens]|uniref:MarR family winged helix-turn-helix transcriptional regulator n=1 Tax=Aciditerrimonas ferrireducens TaxID=667306 RepID=A0ABV6C2W3_9ACTN
MSGSSAGGPDRPRPSTSPRPGEPAPAPRWLSPVELQAWRSLLAGTSRLLARLDDELHATTGLRLVDYGVLVTLAEAPEARLRLHELAERIILSPSGLTRRLDSLVRRGLVERQRCPEDRRGTYAALTPAGQARLAEAAPWHVEQVRRYLVDRLRPDQLAALQAVMDEVLAGLATPERGEAGDTRACCSETA